MNDCISREDVKEYLKRVIFGADQKIDRWIDAIPAADVRPVVRGQDVWNTVTDHHCEFKCSICGEEIREHWGEDFNFCPYCGADMREETDA